MMLITGADLVLPGRVLAPGTLAVEGDRIVDVQPGVQDRRGAHDLTGHVIAPGFIDVHVHGVEGADALDADPEAIGHIAERLPKYGVTAFCPTTIACDPPTLARMLASVARLRTRQPDTAAMRAARVLPAHLESNFINPEYNGAQPIACLRRPHERPADGSFTGDAILDVIGAARPDVAIITLAPELPGAVDLIRELVRQGHRVSLGHSGASYEEAIAGIEAGATQATHLFNRMTPVSHRAPGLAGAVLEHEGVAAELICDGVHVHPAVLKLALAAKRPERVLAVTDGTSGSGLARGARATLGGQRITVGDVARLDDGTIAGSVLTMDRAFALLVGRVGVSLPDAAMVCSTTPAREVGLHGLGVLAPGATADFVVLNRDLQVVATVIAGRPVFGTVLTPGA